MAELGAGIDWGIASKIQPVNALDTMSKLAQTQIYNLDAASKARDFYALQKYGTAAAAGDQEAMTQLMGQNPAAANILSSIGHTASVTAQQKLETQKQFEAGIAQQASQITDPAQKITFLNQALTQYGRAFNLPQAQIDAARSVLTPERADQWIASKIYGGLQPAQVPEVGFRSRKLESTLEPPVTIMQPDPSGTPRPIQVPKGSLPNLPGTPGPGPLFGPPGGGSTPSAPRGTGPRSDAGDTGEGYGGGEGPEIPEQAFNARLYGDESGGRAFAKNPRSSATGLGQFIDSTWANQMRRNFPRETENLSDQEVVQKYPKTDRQLQTVAMRSYRNENAAALADRGLPVNASTLAMAHKLGAGGAARVLTADPNTPMSSILGEEASAANPGWARQTAGSFRRTHENKFSTRPVAGVTRTAAPTSADVGAGTETVEPTVPPGPIRSLGGGVAPGAPSPTRPGMAPPPGTPPGPAVPLETSSPAFPPTAQETDSSGASLPPGATAMDAGDAGGGADEPVAISGQSTPPKGFAGQVDPRTGGVWLRTPEEQKAIDLQQQKQIEEPFQRRQTEYEKEAETRQREREEPMRAREEARKLYQTSGQKIMDATIEVADHSESAKQQLDILDNALDQTVTGPMAPTVKKLYEVVTDISKRLGIDAGNAEHQAAILKTIETAGSELGFDMVKALGSREAQQVVQQVMNIKPNIANTNAQNKMIVEALRQGFQRSIDKKEYMEERVTKGRGDVSYQEAASEFNKKHPVQVYASRVFPLPLPIKDGRLQRDKLVPGAYYDASKKGEKPSGARMQWDGTGFDTSVPKARLYEISPSRIQ
jgi:Zn-finger nucleic acid-binding protein